MKPFGELRNRADALEKGIRQQGENIATAVDVNTAVMVLVGTVAVVALIFAVRALSVVNR